MRIWDVSPGYLNRQSLLGEHAELHALHRIVTEGMRGFSRHPETLRWAGALDALALRHLQLVAEMTLRGYAHRSPLPPPDARAGWPATFLDEPAEQFRLLARRYEGSDRGRIPLPETPQALWAQHKYSVMARDPQAGREIGRSVARMRTRASFERLARELILMLRVPPPRERLANALEHMWGHVRDAAAPEEKRASRQGPALMLATIQVLALRQHERFLLSSTALSELAVHVR